MGAWTVDDPPGSSEGRSSRFRFHGVRVGIALALAAITYAVFPAAPAVDFPLLEVGSVAPDNVIAPFAYSVPKDPADLARERDEVARSVQPIMVYTPAA